MATSIDAIRAIALMFAAVTLVACASTISPKRQDWVIVEGQLNTAGSDWTCGTGARRSGGYFYVCDMPLNVRRVVFGRHSRNTITARFCFLELDREDEIVSGPNITKDRHAAAILWRREDGLHSFVLVKFPGRWCVPDWMSTELSISAEEVAQLSLL